MLYGSEGGVIKEEEKKKKRRSRACPFRFLFGLRKGSRVWDSVPVLPFKSRKNSLISLSRIKQTLEAAKRGFGIKNLSTHHSYDNNFLKTRCFKRFKKWLIGYVIPFAHYLKIPLRILPAEIGSCLYCD